MPNKTPTPAPDVAPEAVAVPDPDELVLITHPQIGGVWGPVPRSALTAALADWSEV